MSSSFGVRCSRRWQRRLLSFLDLPTAFGSLRKQLRDAEFGIRSPRASRVGCRHLPSNAVYVTAEHHRDLSVNRSVERSPPDHRPRRPSAGLLYGIAAIVPTRLRRSAISVKTTRRSPRASHTDSPQSCGKGEPLRQTGTKPDREVIPSSPFASTTAKARRQPLMNLEAMLVGKGQSLNRDRPHSHFCETSCHESRPRLDPDSRQSRRNRTYG
jgi:hypothetical protein